MLQGRYSKMQEAILWFEIGCGRKPNFGFRHKKKGRPEIARSNFFESPKQIAPDLINVNEETERDAVVKVLRLKLVLDASPSIEIKKKSSKHDFVFRE